MENSLSESLTVWVQGHGPWAASWVVGFLSGFMPLLNLEVYVVALGALLKEPSKVAGMVVVVSVSHTAAKLVFYYAAARWGTRAWFWKKIPRAHRDRWVEVFSRSGWRKHLLLGAASFLGIPPLFVVAPVAGLIQLGWMPFALWCVAGRIFRFGLLALVPLVIHWFHSS